MKEKLLKRHSPNTEDRFVEKLSGLNYSRGKYPDLAPYLDRRVHLAKKAYPTMREKQVIRDTIITLPPTIRNQLSLMRQTSKLPTLEGFEQLTSRYDCQPIQTTNRIRFQT